MPRALDLRPLVLAALDGYSEEFYGKPFSELPESEQRLLTQNLAYAAEKLNRAQSTQPAGDDQMRSKGGQIPRIPNLEPILAVSGRAIK